MHYDIKFGISKNTLTWIRHTTTQANNKATEQCQKYSTKQFGHFFHYLFPQLTLGFF